jgi:hypothetical protein
VPVRFQWSSIVPTRTGWLGSGHRAGLPARAHPGWIRYPERLLTRPRRWPRTNWAMGRTHPRQWRANGPDRDSQESRRRGGQSAGRPGRSYRELGAHHYTQCNPERAVRRMTKEAKSLGLTVRSCSTACADGRGHGDPSGEGLRVVGRCVPRLIGDHHSVCVRELNVTEQWDEAEPADASDVPWMP